MALSDDSMNEAVDASLPTWRDDEHFIERHDTFLKWIMERPIDLLFLGDSITRRWVDVRPLWEHYFAIYQPANFGVGGDAVQNLLWQIQNGQLDGFEPRVIVLLIGANNVPTNTGEEIASAINKVIDIIQKKLPDTQIILLAIFPRGPQTPDKGNKENPYYMDIVNIANAELAKLGNEDNIHFLDFGSQFIGPDGEIDTDLMPDQLHIIEPGFKIWGEAMKDLLAELMN